MNTVDNQLPFVFRASNLNKNHQQNARVDTNFADNNLGAVDLNDTELNCRGLNKAQLMNAGCEESDLSWNLQNN
ncbi:MAG: hypothetical protein AAFY76_11115, partial [Cyanobacteria bacterium J06649_11]